MAVYAETARNSGLVETRRARVSGRLVSIYRAEPAGIDAETPYVVVCEEHSTLLDAETLRLARAFLAVPYEWCEPCQAELSHGG